MIFSPANKASTFHFPNERVLGIVTYLASVTQILLLSTYTLMSMFWVLKNSYQGLYSFRVQFVKLTVYVKRVQDCLLDQM